MGRPQEKDLAEESKKISIFWLKKKNLLGNHSSGSIFWTWGDDPDNRSSISIVSNIDEGYFELDYTQTSYYLDEKRKMNYRHGLISTPCNFGGVRYWFECRLSRNGRYCGRRVGVLYKSSGAWHWGCRHCHNIGYSSQLINYSNPLFVIFDLETKAEDLESGMKRWYWGGKPTRKHKKLLKLYRKMGYYQPQLKQYKP